MGVSDMSQRRLEEVTAVLKRLDVLLSRALAALGEVYGADATTDPYRGLHISPDEAIHLLGRGPGKPNFPRESEADADLVLGGSLDGRSRLAWLARVYGLSGFDLELVVIALASEFDLRYERLYAYLQDDVNRRRPTVDLALNLLCQTAEEKLVRRAHFASNGPLVEHGLLRIVPDPNQVQPPLLARYLILDEQVSGFLLGHRALDHRLVPFCRRIEPGSSEPALRRHPLLDSASEQAVMILTRKAVETGESLKLYFHGPSRPRMLAVAEAVAQEVGAPLLQVALTRVLGAEADYESTLNVAFREAELSGAILFLDGVDALNGADHALRRERFMERLTRAKNITLLTGEGPWVESDQGGTGVISIPVVIPDYPRRRAAWQEHLARAHVEVDASDLDALASRFQLMPDQISGAVAMACARATWRAAGQSADGQFQQVSFGVSVTDLFAAACAQSGQDLAKLARRIEPRYAMGDIVLPPDQLEHLADICRHAQYRHVVYGEWGFDRKLSLGKGLNVLFSGPPGTGKTMAAEVIAHELRLDLYKIDLSQVVSKYIGETEKNLDRIFTAAETSNAILFFDEADALFGKRSEVKDAHDRYANIEVGYLLQKMEEYDGIAILATNLSQNLDEAFVRRMQFIVEFPFPDEAHRRRIWEVIFPREAPLGPDVDYDALARAVRLAGGNIKNIALAAAFRAAGDGRVIRMEHLVRASRREHQKLGRTWDEAG